MKYKVTTSILVDAGDLSHHYEWIFDTREEAQKFVDEFYKEFPKDQNTMDDPYISTWGGRPEIEEFEEPVKPDPYAWLADQVAKKKERIEWAKKRAENPELHWWWKNK